MPQVKRLPKSKKNKKPIKKSKTGSRKVSSKSTSSSSSSSSTTSTSSSSESSSPSDTVQRVPPWWTKQDPRLPKTEKPFRLNSTVRGKYMQHLQKLLQTNYESCIDNDPTQDLPEFSDRDFEQCASELEMRAVQSCMVVYLYRKAMLKTLAEIRRKTNCYELHQRLKTYTAKTKEMSVQTSPLPVPAPVVITDKTSTEPKPILDVNLLCMDTQIAKTETTPVFVNNKHSLADSKLEIQNIYNNASESRDSFSAASQNDMYNCFDIHPLKPATAERFDKRNVFSELSCKKPSITERLTFRNMLPKKISLDERLAHLVGTDHSNKTLDKIRANKYYQHTVTAAVTKPPNIKRHASVDTKHRIRRPTIIKPILMKSTDDACSLGSNESTAELPPLIMPKPNKNKEIEDSLMHELEEMFKETTTDNIFEDTPNDTRIEAIITEIKTKSNALCENGTEINESNNKETVVKVEECTIPEKKIKKISIWPCELHMQRRKLRIILDGITEKSMRYHAKVKRRFIELFDEDSEDDQAIESPITNEEHKLSCTERIAPWVVKGLMPFYVNGRIIGKHLFKKVAKHIADLIITNHPYPEEKYIYTFIDEYFMDRLTISTKADIYTPNVED